MNRKLRYALPLIGILLCLGCGKTRPSSPSQNAKVVTAEGTSSIPIFNPASNEEVINTSLPPVQSIPIQIEGTDGRVPQVFEIAGLWVGVLNGRELHWTFGPGDALRVTSPANPSALATGTFTLDNNSQTIRTTFTYARIDNIWPMSIPGKVSGPNELLMGHGAGFYLRRR